MSKILVTGGCGYIGSHTVVDLLDNGYDVVCIDNLIRSSEDSLNGVHKITGKKVRNYKVDLCDLEASRKVFEEHKDITGVIHFAALKSVPESVDQPLFYHYNNGTSLINILRLVKEFKVPYFVFSSSCSVYGNTKALPVNEETPMEVATSPYARTKQIGELIIKDASLEVDASIIMLRYFNPVGAHPSAEIGEVPVVRPDNLTPIITRTAIGKYPEMKVHGGDYDTRDGSALRDYVHVMDIARAHTLALRRLADDQNEEKVEIFNLGTGNGYTVLETIQAFEKVSGVKLNYSIGPRRDGDVEAIYSDNKKAAEKLNWKAQIGIDEMMDTAWRWEVKLRDQGSGIKDQGSGIMDQ
ncbi:MAG: UDP-glucose 4-epimerase GalE [Bacteroidetes bacterium]|nr:UDP-glucose 4-epimerase GalE [Bacteroidota bacterium]